VVKRKQTPSRAVGYVRVSTSEQAGSGAGLTAQRNAIKEAAERRSWELVTVLEDAGVSAACKKRPALDAAIGLIEAGGADVLVVSKLDRLSRSLLHFVTLVQRAEENGWVLVVLDQDFDLSTPTGRLMSHMLASFAEFERALISQRTKDALAVKRAEGVVLGRPSGVPADVLRRIAREAKSGASLGAIARGLNEDEVPTSQGGAQWYPSTVRALLERAKKGSKP
jgi:DNA invertase Pin-like site-specific DNA recombinase